MARLGDICTLVNGYAFKPTDWKTEGLPIIRIQNLNDTTAPFNYFEGEIDRKYIINDGDLLFSWSGTPGTSFGAFFWRRGKGVLNQHIFNVYPVDGISKAYLRYALNGNISRIIDKAHGGVGLQHITKKELVEIDIPILSEDQQKKIVTVLDSVDRLIALRKKQLAKLDELVKARFVEMFGSLHDNQKGFEIVTIDDLCTLIKDGTHQTPTYTEDRKAGFKFLSSKDVMTQKICWEGIKYIPADLHEKLYATIKPRRNDILMSKNGVNYGVAAVNDTDEIFDIYVSLALLRPKVDRVNPVFFRCAINNQDTKRQFDGSIKGIGVPNLHLGEIKKTKILVPPMNQQNEFVAFVEQTEKSKLTIQSSLDKLEVMKKALMQEYFG